MRNIPLLIRRGVKFGPILIVVQDGNGDPVPLTGWQVFSLARPTINSPNTYDLAPTITDAPNGEVTYELTDDQTEREFPAGEYVYDFVLENPSGERLDPMFSGQLTVLDTPSRR